MHMGRQTYEQFAVTLFSKTYIFRVFMKSSTCYGYIFAIELNRRNRLLKTRGQQLMANLKLCREFCNYVPAMS